MAVLQDQEAAGTPAAPVEAPKVYGTTTGLVGGAPTVAPTSVVPPLAAPAPAARADQTTDATGRVISGDTLAARLERTRRAESRRILREEYGTDDPAKIAEIRKQRAAAADDAKKRDEEYARLKAEDEKRQREAMTEQQRLAADLEASKKREQALKDQLAEATNRQVSTEQEKVIREAASRHVDEDLLDDAMTRFARYLRDLERDKPAELKRMNERTIEKWFERLAKDRPKFAKAAPAAADAAAPTATAPAAVAAATPVRRAVIRTTAKPAGTRPGANPPTVARTTGATAKTARPGQANSMSRAELRADLKRRGLQGW